MPPTHHLLHNTDTMTHVQHAHKFLASAIGNCSAMTVIFIHDLMACDDATNSKAIDLAAMLKCMQLHQLWLEHIHTKMQNSARGYDKPTFLFSPIAWSGILNRTPMLLSSHHTHIFIGLDFITCTGEKAVNVARGLAYDSLVFGKTGWTRSNT